MATYFFDLYNDMDVADPEGGEFPGDAEAIEHGFSEARAMAAATVCEGHFIGEHRIEVRREDGTIAASVRFDEAVKVEV